MMLYHQFPTYLPFITLINLYCIGLLCMSGLAGAYPPPGKVTGDVKVHDPTMIRVDDGGYYLYSTHNGLEARFSKDRIDFVKKDPALPDGALWAKAKDKKELWAPDISKRGDKYYLYYAVPKAGHDFVKGHDSAIGLATSTSGRPGTWTDHGKVLESDDSTAFNAIDPNLFVDSKTRKWLLTFGSFSKGIYQVELDPNTGKKRKGAKFNRIAARPNDAVEAPFLWQHGSFYYLFTSFDLCCKGVESTYRIMVSRSESPSGPFVDRNNVRALEGGGTQILGTHPDAVVKETTRFQYPTVIGPGGQSVFNDDGQDILVYHYYDGHNKGEMHLGINNLCWHDDWPFVC